MTDNHPWKLVAPWYRWKQQGGTPRETRPAIQKFESADFVNQFLADPQRSLRFTDDDLVVVYEQVARIANDFFKAPQFPDGVFPKMVLPKEPKNGGPNLAVPPAESIAKPGTVRKLFLDTHKRHYLVVVELHCDAPGFPSTSRDQICEMGFVVRRRRTVMTEDQAKDAAKILNTIDKAAIELQAKAASAKLQKIEQDYQAALAAKKGISKQQLWKEMAHSPLQTAKLAALQTIASAKAKLAAWSKGVDHVLEGWVPSEFDKIGSWQVVDEEPQVITETIFPMYALIPDPRRKDHAAAGKTLYFGVIPTGSADTTDDGTARFDPGSTYEVKCFVRRHKPECPKKATRNDCPGPIVWSRSTEKYQIAAHFDLIGTSQRPVTVQLPNIPELAAQAASLPPQKIAPFKLASPNGASNLGFKLDDPKDPGSGKADPPGGIPEICSFAIPLITIVVTFVFKLFLPIVTLLFGLSFLLKLKFCIPPSLEIGLKVTAAIDFVPPELSLDAGLSVELGGEALVDLKAGLGLPEAATDLEVTAAIHTGIQEDLTLNFGADVAAELAASYSNEALVDFEVQVGTDSTDPDAASLTASLQYEAPVLQAEVQIS